MTSLPCKKFTDVEIIMQSRKLLDKSYVYPRAQVLSVLQFRVYNFSHLVLLTPKYLLKNLY
jgi:hypothetical protein